jgi:hypothetical protein
VTCDRSVVFSRSSGFSTNKTYRHDIAEILLKVALSTIKQLNMFVCFLFVFLLVPDVPIVASVSGLFILYFPFV